VIVFGLIVAVTTLAAGLAAALALQLFPTLRLRLTGLALLGVALPLAAVSLSGLVMFQDGHDLVVLLVAAASSSAAVAAALLVAGSIARSIDRIRGASAALAAGDLGARAPREGPEELAALGGSLNEMAEKLERLFDARRQLVAWASHDLRTPLASMQAMLEALEDGLAGPSDYLPALREQVRVLSRLVDDLFELTRIDTGSLTMELAEARLDGLVESAVRGFAATARARQVALDAQLDATAPAVLCAPDKVERVLYNLLTNALRHTPSDGAVAVRVSSLAAEVCVTVEDTGAGIPDDSLQRAFDRFWRADRARSGPGAGLGLAIAQDLVELQGGRIWAEHRPGGGASVSFTLPAVT
jgi:signal transduction histidine kinase